MDVYREKPIRLVVKVAVPVKEHPKVKVKLLEYSFLYFYSNFKFSCLHAYHE